MSAFDGERLHARFDHAGPITVGLEEELLVLDGSSHGLVPRAHELLGAVAGDPRFKAEMPAAQLEIVTAPSERVEDLQRELTCARERLQDAALPLGLAVAGAGIHPCAAGEGPLNPGERYAAIEAEFGRVARSQLICGLHVHVRLAGAERTLAVYNELRAHLPEIAALAANAPLYEGADSGMASVRPLISARLPRQGVPPELESWEHYARELSWGQAGGRLRSPREWWWELRPHPVLGTLEVRVADAQSRVADAAAVAGFVAALVLWLAERHDGGDLPPPASQWRIAENRWSAARHGVQGTLADVRTGAVSDTRTVLLARLAEIAPWAPAVGAERAVGHAHALVEENGAMAQRAQAAAHGIGSVPAWLSGLFRV